MSVATDSEIDKIASEIDASPERLHSTVEHTPVLADMVVEYLEGDTHIKEFERNYKALVMTGCLVDQ